MKDKLRELAGEMRNELCSDFAQKLEAILDAEGDGGAVGEYVANVDKYGGVLWIKGPPAHGTKIYTHPARSGVVSDEDVRDAERWRYLRREVISASWLINGGSLVKTLEDSCDPSAFDRAIDAARKGERHEH